VTDRRRAWALVVVCASVLVTSIDTLILNVALPTLVRELNASTSELQWIVDAYILVFAGFLLVGGSLGDRFGRAMILRVGLVVFGVASACAAFSANATTLIVCRGVMGFAAALIMPTSIAVLTNVFADPADRGRALGVWSASAGLGLAIGPVVGGLLLSRFWWGSVFLVNVPIVAVVLVIAIFSLPESRNPEASQFDPLGVVLSVVGVSALVWATIQAPSEGWGSATTLRNFAVAAVLLVFLVVWELRCEHPMLELAFFRNPRFSIASLASGTANYAFAGTLFVLTQLLQFVFGYSPLVSGLSIVPMAVCFMAAGLLGPRLNESVGTSRAVALGLAVFAVGLGVLAMVDVNTGVGLVLVATLAIGVGFGFTLAPTTDAVVGAVPREKAGMASGTLSATRQVATAMGVAVMGSLLVSGYRSVLATRTRGLGLSHADITSSRTSVGSALEVAHRISGDAGHALGDAAQAAFIHGSRLAMIAGAALLVLGAILSLMYLPAHASDVRDAVDLDEAPQVPILDVIVE
jgi:EmrB/QacA subfamily drug resistance transporter